MGITRVILLVHRYLGIAVGLLLVLWFASGFVIMYTGGMPALSESERLTRLAELNFRSIEVDPEQARRLIGETASPILTSVMGRPAYRFPSGVVFADSGERLSRRVLSSRQIVAEFSGAHEQDIERLGRVGEVDQWTIGLQGELPLEKFRVRDGRGSQVYVSPRYGQVVLHTTRPDRVWAWFGAIPHWLYVVELRRDTALWNRVVLWLAALGCVLTLLGLVMIFTQLRPQRPFNWSTAIPYRGVMRWHYQTGALFGLATLGWMFSGLLSMEPWAWTRASGLALPRDLLQGGAVDLDRFTELGSALTEWQVQAGEPQIKEVSFHRTDTSYYYRITVVARDSHWGFERRLVSADTGTESLLPLTQEDVLTRLAGATDHAIRAADLLSDYDHYYYSRQSRHEPMPVLPVLRIKFADPQETWVYVDMLRAELVARNSRWNRLDRWLYNGLHSLDVAAFYRQRPLWDVVVIVLLSGGLVLVVLGCIQGWRRPLRQARAWCRRWLRDLS